MCRYKNKAIVAEGLMKDKAAQEGEGEQSGEAEPTAEDLESTPNLFAKP